MKVYISGRVTGIKDFEKYFAYAAQETREQASEPVNPYENFPKIKSWDKRMRRNLKLLTECDAVYMLWGWQWSKGARLEFHVASSLGMPVYFQPQEFFVDAGK